MKPQKRNRAFSAKYAIPLPKQIGFSSCTIGATCLAPLNSLDYSTGEGVRQKSFGPSREKFPNGNIFHHINIRRGDYSRTGICIWRSILKEKVKSPAEIGQAVRKKRKKDGLTLADAAALCGVGYRFLSDLENGKPTAELGKTLQVLAALGLEVRVGPKEWPDA